MLRIFTIIVLLSTTLILTGCSDFPSPPTRTRPGHYERQTTGYKLRRNSSYDIWKRRGYSDQQLSRWGIQEYKLEPQDQWVWVPE